ncbi:MAG: zinc ribbon domain-containing protein [Candidatus Bathyarchaeia archaeon]
MTKCSNCGFNVPEDAVFCPNCGAPVRRVIRTRRSSENIWGIIRLGLIGAFLSLIITAVISSAAEGINLYFIPSFLSALIVIYTSRTKDLKDATIISALTYLFAYAITSGLFLGTLYAHGESLASYYSTYFRDAPTLIDVILSPISPITAIIAGFLGYKIAPKRREVFYEYHVESDPILFCGIKSALKKLKYILLGFFIGVK